MARFDNKKTIVSALAIELNVENGTFDAKPVTAELDYYVRAIDKATAALREACNIDANTILQNVEVKHIDLKPKEYNIGKLIHDGFEFVFDEPENEDDFVVIPATLYKYQGNVFCHEIESGDPFAQFFETGFTHQKFSKSAARSYILEEYEAYIPECKVLFVERHPHKVLRSEVNVWFKLMEETAESYIL